MPYKGNTGHKGNTHNTERRPCEDEGRETHVKNTKYCWQTKDCWQELGKGQGTHPCHPWNEPTLLILESHTSSCQIRQKISFEPPSCYSALTSYIYLLLTVTSNKYLKGDHLKLYLAHLHTDTWLDRWNKPILIWLPTLSKCQLYLSYYSGILDAFFLQNPRPTCQHLNPSLKTFPESDHFQNILSYLLVQVTTIISPRSPHQLFYYSSNLLKTWIIQYKDYKDEEIWDATDAGKKPSWNFPYLIKCSTFCDIMYHKFPPDEVMVIKMAKRHL